MSKNKAAIILAAGKGTRMKSSMPKVMHKIAGWPMIQHVVTSCQSASIDTIVTVIADGMDDVRACVAPHDTTIQTSQNGTGDAAKSAYETLKDFNGYIFILNGDLPFVTHETLDNLYQSATKTGISVLGFQAENPHGYGRFITNGHALCAIIEEKDCTDAQRQITLCNAGAYCVHSDYLFQWLGQLNNDNAQGEYYLTDLIAIATQNDIACGYAVTDEAEAMGVNSRIQLSQAEQVMQNILRNKAMADGVTMIDPSSVTLAMDTQFDQDVIVEPNVFFGLGVSVGTNTIIRASSHIEGTIIGDNCEIGPFARLRPKSKIGDFVSVGNFIEVNRSEFENGAKSKHLSYIGDAIIGEKSNIGAGTVIANYDGFNKHTTYIGGHSFIGSNSTIVAPVSVGDDAIIAAGSTITNDVKTSDMAIGRARQIVLEGRAAQYREDKKS